MSAISDLAVAHATQCGVEGCTRFNDGGIPLLVITEVDGDVLEVELNVCSVHRRLNTMALASA